MSTDFLRSLSQVNTAGRLTYSITNDDAGSATFTAFDAAQLFTLPVPLGKHGCLATTSRPLSVLHQAMFAHRAFAKQGKPVRLA